MAFAARFTILTISQPIRAEKSDDFTNQRRAFPCSGGKQAKQFSRGVNGNLWRLETLLNVIDICTLLLNNVQIIISSYFTFFDKTKHFLVTDKIKNFSFIKFSWILPRRLFFPLYRYTFKTNGYSLFVCVDNVYIMCVCVRDGSQTKKSDWRGGYIT